MYLWVKLQIAQKYVVILADYFDYDDIKSVFPSAIQKIYGYCDIKYLPSDYENSESSDLARNLAYPNDKYGWIFVVTQKWFNPEHDLKLLIFQLLPPALNPAICIFQNSLL